MQSTKFMLWNMKLKAILPIWLTITKQLKVAKVELLHPPKVTDGLALTYK